MHDAIVIGARCAGSPTAMLLARGGHRVLLVDRAKFPSDTMSTHIIHPHGLAALRRWGLLEQLIATGPPVWPSLRADFGPVVLDGTPTPVDGISEHYSPRRTVLDKLLVDAAVDAGAELCEGAAVTGLLRDGDRVTGIRANRNGGPELLESAAIVIGADGVHSTVAKHVDAPVYSDKGLLTCAYYSYWSAVDSPKGTLFPRSGCVLGEIPTHDGLTCVYGAWPAAEFRAVRRDIPGRFTRTIEQHAPDLAARMHGATREERFVGSGQIPNHFRHSYGPGWALAGDAAHHKDPIGAHGITDAFRDAERIAEAVHAGLTGEQNMEMALAASQRDRDDTSLALFELNSQLATLESPKPEMQALIGALATNQPETDRFIGALCGTVPVPEFFAPDNLARIVMAEAAGTPP
ncbi:MAG: FAD-dependent monooxygenase [Actinomycetota bacterium]|nr:FAD-dependent monooxygenase [Actinomycetota bacterium]